MSIAQTSSVSLRIASKTLSCVEISRILDWQPSRQFDKGEPLYKGNPKKLREEYFWIYDLNLDEKIFLEEQLKALINLILKKEDSFRKLKECSIDIFCWYTSYNGQGGFVIESNLMGELASLNIDLLVEFWATEDKKTTSGN